jgi:hypothetical protein
VAISKTTVTSTAGGIIRVTRIGERGDTLFSRVIPFVGDRIPQKDIDSLRTRCEAKASASGKEACKTLPASLVWNPLEHLVIGEDSTTWLGLRATAKGTPWLILDAKGKPLASVTLPSDVEIRVADLSAIWGVQKNADEIESIVRYKVIH